MTEGLAQLKIRLPADAKAFLEREAAINSSSQNSEIIRAVRERMKAKGPAEAPTSPDQGSENPQQGKSHEHHGM